MTKAPATAAPTKLVIRNVGLMLSGDLARPILDADAIVAVDGRIAAIGRAARTSTSKARRRSIDAQGAALAPGLIDSHVHPVAGDWTPRQNQLGWINSCLHGGVTTMISAGEVHTPGRPRDIVGLKAMAITAQRYVLEFSRQRREGARRRAGDRARHGGERFRGARRRGRQAARRGRPRRRQGWRQPRARWSPGRANTASTARSTPAVPRSPAPGLIDKDIVLEADTDVIGHINGGHTALPDDQIALPVRAMRARARTRAQRQRARGAVHAAHSQGARPVRARHPRHRRAGRLGRAAARHPADGRACCRRSARCRAGGRVLLRHRQHRADARTRLRADRGRHAPPISCSSIARSIRPARRCSTACGSATCRASA